MKAQRAKKSQPAVKEQQGAKSENHNVEGADHQSTDRSVSMTNHYGTNAQKDEQGVKKQRVKKKDPPLTTTNQHVANHRQQVDTTMTDPPVVTANIQDTTMDKQVVVLVDRKSRQVIVQNPREEGKKWATFSFSLSDPGTLGIVVLRLHNNITNQTYTFIKDVIAGSQADTAGVMVGDVVVAEFGEVMKWVEGPRPIHFSVFRELPSNQVVQQQPQPPCLSDAVHEQAKEHLRSAIERQSVPQKEPRQAVASTLSEHGMHGETASRHIKLSGDDGKRVQTQSLDSKKEKGDSGGQKATDMPGQGAAQKAPSTAKPVASISAGNGSVPSNIQVSSPRKVKARLKSPPQSSKRASFAPDDVFLNPSTNEDDDVAPRPSVTTDIPIARVNNEQVVNYADRPVIKTNPQRARKRDWAGSNKEGGVGMISDARAADDGTDTMYYDVSYSLDGREKGIDRQYVNAHQFPEHRNAHSAQSCEDRGVVPKPQGHSQGHGGSKNSSWKEPKKTEDVLYQRPVGRLRKGTDCDSKRGTWIPLSNPDLARDCCIEETAQGKSDEPASDNGREKEESVNQGAEQAPVSAKVPRIASTDALPKHQGRKRTLTAELQMMPPPRRKLEKEKRREEKSAFIQSLEEVLSKLEHARLNVGKRRAQRAHKSPMTMTKAMIELAIRVWHMIPEECGSVQEASAHLEDVDASAYRIEKFLIGDPGTLLHTKQHGETEVALSKWLANKEATKAHVGVQVDEEMADSQLKADLTNAVVGSHVAVYWPDDDEYYEATVLRVRHKETKLLHFLEYDDGDSEWIDLCEHKFRVHRRTDHEIHDNDSLISASNHDSLQLESEARGEESIAKSCIEKRTNPHEKPKILSEGYPGSIDREGLRTVEGEILPRLTPKKIADGTYMRVQCNALRANTIPNETSELLSATSMYARPPGKSPKCMKWDYSRGVWAPKYKRKGKTQAESSEESEARVVDEVCETADAPFEHKNDDQRKLLAVSVAKRDCKGSNKDGGVGRSCRRSCRR